MKHFRVGERVFISEVYENNPLYIGGQVIKIPSKNTEIFDNDITGKYGSSGWSWGDCECERDSNVKHAVLLDGERKYFVRMDNGNINLVF